MRAMGTADGCGMEDATNNSHSIPNHNGDMYMNRRKFLKGTMALGLVSMIPLESMFMPNALILEDCVIFLYDQEIIIRDDGKHYYKTLAKKIGGLNNGKGNKYYVTFCIEGSKCTTVKEAHAYFYSQIVDALRFVLVNERYDSV